MKWLKKHKDEIINGTQVFLVVNSMVDGFWFNYLLIWYMVGLPLEWYWIVVTLVLGGLSVIGLVRWCYKTNT